MKLLLKVLLVFVISTSTAYAQQFNAPVDDHRNRLFDDNWLFKKGNLKGPEGIGFDDSQWRKLMLPHDWSIEDIQPEDIQTAPDSLKNNVIGPFWKHSEGTIYTGFVLGRTAWYRKHFTLGANDDGKNVTINFDGVYRDAQVWLNGKYLGEHPYGYTAFNYDLTPYLNKAGQPNIIAVKVNNEGISSRWYSGSGIYRHVWLTVTEPVHIDTWGVTVKCEQISTASAEVGVQSHITNTTKQTAKIKLKITLISPQGKIVAQGIQDVVVNGNGVSDANKVLKVNKPELWGLQTPILYQAKVEVIDAGKTIDQSLTNFGIRSLAFTAAKGFQLNGETIKLKGGCIHHDNGILGSVSIDRAEIRKVELLKANGFNAIRCSHNPPSIQFLDACDRVGMLVIDEAFDTWNIGKTKQDYSMYFKDNWKSDIKTLVTRDRNHPSIILWSLGNEIPEKADSLGLATELLLYNEVKKYDTSRPVTEGINILMKPDKRKRPQLEPAFAMLDIKGNNYMWNFYAEDHKQHPDWVIIGTESFPMAAFENWRELDKDSYAIGDFVWSGMDYLGEAGVGRTFFKGDSEKLHWPYFNAYCGDIDLIGQEKPQMLYKDVIWNKRKIAMMVHVPLPDGKEEVVSHWGWPEEFESWNWQGNEGKAMAVHVYTKLPKVRLELNGKSIQTVNLTPAMKYTATFSVPYNNGQLKAIGLDSASNEVTSTIIKTTGKPYTLKINADRKRITSSTNDLSYLTIEVVDKDGNVVPEAIIPITCQVSGDGNLQAFGNANPTDMQSFQDKVSNSWRGRSLAIIRPIGKAGTVRVSVSAPGLQTSNIEIQITDK